MRWEAGADELSIPQTKIRVSGYFLLLNCMALSKYPFFVKSNTKKWFLSFFRLSRPKFFVYWFWLGQANNSKIFTCLYSAVACDWSGARRHVLKACVWSTHAFKTNKKILWKIDFPPPSQPFLRLVELKLLLHGVAQNLEEKRVQKYFRNFRVLPRWKQCFLTVTS